MKNPRIISFANHKGGVGKTTTTANVGSILAQKGYKVLVIDLDPQANLTFSLYDGEIGDSIYEAMTDRIDTLPVLNISENLDLVPSTLDLCAAEFELASAMSRESILRNLLVPIQEEYNFILMDCPPSLGILTINGMAASNEIIVPLIAEAAMSFISNYFAMLEFVITFVKNQSSDARLAVFTEGRSACIIRNIILTRCLSLLRYLRS